MANVIPSFQPLTRAQAKASILIQGLTGTGKSGTALLLAFALTGGFKEGVTEEERWEMWNSIYAVDTENHSLKLFGGVPCSAGVKYPDGAIKVHELDANAGYRPSNYLALRAAAINAGAKVFIADSITHMWTAKGGVLDLVDQIRASNPKMDNYRVWGDPDVAEEKTSIAAVIRDENCHVITTVRVKEQFTMQYNPSTEKNEVVSLGEQQIQQGDLKYEPDLVLAALSPGTPTGEPPKVQVLKTRYAIFNKDEIYELTPQVCEQLRQYLDQGVDPAVLLEERRKDYIVAVKEYLDQNSNAKSVWKVLKADAGHANTKLEDLPLDVVSKCFGILVN